MKTKKSITRIASVVLLAAMIVMVVISCKKKDGEEPTVNNDPVITDGPPAFLNQPLNIMSDYEINNHKDFASALFYKHFSEVKVKHNMLGGAFPYSSIFSALGSVYKYYEHKQEMAELKGYLDNYNTELTEIINEIKALSAQLALTETVILNNINSINALSEISAIETAYGTDYLGLRYYTNLGAQFQNGTIDSSQMADGINPYIDNFVTSIFTSTDLETAINDLNGLLCGSSALGFDGSLKTYAKLIVQTMGPTSDSSRLRMAYELLENYFQYTLTYQFQACIVKTNVLNYKSTDTTGAAGINFIKNYFTPVIVEELNEFLQVVDYFALNAYDYRNNIQFANDLTYSGAGLAPDNKCVNVLSRARFLVNTYLDALGLPYPSYCGEIVLPQYYSAGMQVTPSFNVTMGGIVMFQSTDTTISSQIPYTYWTQPMNYQWDNNWMVCKYAQVADAGHSFPCTPSVLQVVDNSNQNLPWFHLNSIKGSVTPMYYNPQNPSQTSTTKTSDCSMQFSFYSSTWRWGFLKLYYTDRSGGQSIIPYCNDIPVHGGLCKALEPGSNAGLNVMEYHSTNQALVDFTSIYGNGLSTTPQRGFNESYVHGLPSTNNSWLLTDMFSFTASKVATDNEPVNAFCNASLSNSYAYSSSCCGLRAGTALTEPMSNCYLVANRAIDFQQWANATGTWIVTGSVQVGSNPSNPCFQWYFTSTQPTSNINVGISVDIKMQYVTTYNYPLP